MKWFALPLLVVIGCTVNTVTTAPATSSACSPEGVWPITDTRTSDDGGVCHADGLATSKTTLTITKSGDTYNVVESDSSSSKMFGNVFFTAAECRLSAGVVLTMPNATVLRVFTISGNTLSGTGSLVMHEATDSCVADWTTSATRM